LSDTVDCTGCGRRVLLDRTELCGECDVRVCERCAEEHGPDCAERWLLERFETYSIAGRVGSCVECAAPVSGPGYSLFAPDGAEYTCCSERCADLYVERESDLPAREVA
jgi:hypothetical protein